MRFYEGNEAVNRGIKVYSQTVEQRQPCRPGIGPLCGLQGDLATLQFDDPIDRSETNEPEKTPRYRESRAADSRRSPPPRGAGERGVPPEREAASPSPGFATPSRREKV